MSYSRRLLPAADDDIVVRRCTVWSGVEPRQAAASTVRRAFPVPSRASSERSPCPGARAGQATGAHDQPLLRSQRAAFSRCALVAQLLRVRSAPRRARMLGLAVSRPRSLVRPLAACSSLLFLLVALVASERRLPRARLQENSPRGAQALCWPRCPQRGEGVGAGAAGCVLPRAPSLAYCPPAGPLQPSLQQPWRRFATFPRL